MCTLERNVPMCAKLTSLILLFGAVAVLSLRLRMVLDPGLTKIFPRNYAAIPWGTHYGYGEDEYLNKVVEEKRISFLEEELNATLRKAVSIKERLLFSTALIAGDAVILDALARAELLSRIPVVFIDTFTLFPETIQHLKEVEAHYGFVNEKYHAADCADAEEFHRRQGRDLWMRDTDQYNRLCKVEPMSRALREHDTDCWINGRRRDHGAERASLPVWEGKKLNPLAFWTFEDCWAYLRRHAVPYHPLHDVGFASLGDMHSTRKVDPTLWFAYGGERSGRFQSMVGKDGKATTECGIHTEITGKARFPLTPEMLTLLALTV